MDIAVIDIGGTSIKYGLYTDGVISNVRETPTEAKKGGEHIVNKLIELLGTYEHFDRIGISTAGQVNSDTGSIIYANPNIPNYTGTKIKERLQEHYNVPIAVLNDVNAAAIGECSFGVGRKLKDKSFLCLTYGTGIGGAIVENGKIYNGSGYSAAEFGAILTHSSERDAEKDIMSGCYERYASTTALVRYAKEIYPEIQNGRDIFAKRDDEKMREVIDRWTDEIVYGLVTLTHIFNPSAIVLGGGVMGQSFLVDIIDKKLRQNIMSSFAGVELFAAESGNNAGMLGAGFTAQNI